MLAVASITHTSSDHFFIDTTQGDVATCNYASFRITNDATPDADLWVKIDSFTGGVVGPAPGEDGIFHLGALAATASGTAFFYLQAPTATTTDQGYQIAVYASDPRIGSPPIVLQQGFSFVDVLETLTASDSKVFSTSYAPATPVLGGTVTITVNGQLGQVSAAYEAGFTPACYASWLCDVYELQATTISITGGANAQTRTNTLLFDGMVQDSGGNPYTAVYTFRVVGMTASPVPTSPTQFVGKNVNFKHANFDETPIVPLPPTVNTTTLAKVAAPTSLPAAGGTVDFTLRLTNTSAQPVTVDQLVDTLPIVPAAETYKPGTSKFNGVPIGDPLIVANVLTWSGLFTVPASGFVDLTFQGLLPPVPGSYTDRAIGLIGATQIDTSLDTTINSPATATVEVSGVADLAILKTDGTPTYTPGAPETYTITVTNVGPNAVTAARVQDTIPALATSASWTAAFVNGSGAASGTGDIDEFIDLAVGGTATYTLVMNIAPTATATLTNTATVTPPANRTDPNPTNNTSTDIDLAAPRADLAITKTDTFPTYVPGGTTSYIVVVTNNGPSFVTGATVVDTFSPLITGATWTAVFAGAGSGGTAAGSGNIAETINLAVGGTATYTITAAVSPFATTSLVNTATVAPPIGTIDPVVANNTATDTDTATPICDLAILKTDGTTTYVPGLTTFYTITVTNNGPSFLAGGRITDSFPASITGATWVAVYTDSGGGGPAAGVGNIDAVFNLAPGGTATFTVTAPVLSSATGNLVNTATVAVPPGTTDPTPGNNTSTDTDTPAPIADLAILKTDGTATYLAGQPTVYTVTISNIGPSDVVAARVVDVLSPLIGSATWTAAFTGGSGTAAGSGSIDQLIALQAGGTAVYTITALVLVSASGNLINTATVTPPAGTTDPNPTNNSATDVDIPLPPRTGLVTGTDDGCASTPLVRVLDPATGQTLSEFLAYESSFRGGVRVAVGDVTGDGIDEIVTAPGRGRVGEVRVWTQAGVELIAYRTLPFGSGYRGGVEVALGDVTGDGQDDLVTAMSNGVGRVSVFEVLPLAADPVVNLPYRSFVPFAGPYAGGVNVAAADFGTFVNGTKTSWLPDGRCEVVVGTNAGIVATVRMYDLSVGPKIVGAIKPIAAKFTGGVTLSIGHWNSDGIPDILVGAGVNGMSVVEVYRGSTFTRAARLTAFSTFVKPNAKVYATSLDTSGDGIIDRVYAVQGQQGTGGTSGVTAWTRVGGLNTLLPLSAGYLPPLRIASMTKRSPLLGQLRRA